MVPRKKKNNPPRRRSVEAKALALKHFRQRKLPNKKHDAPVPTKADISLGIDDWFDFPDEGNDGC